MNRITRMLAVTVLVVFVHATPIRAAITLGCPTFGAAGGTLTSVSLSGLTVAAEPVVGVSVAPPLSIAAGFVACLEGRLSPLDVAPEHEALTFGLSPVAPNPMRGPATIGFTLARPGFAEVRVFDGAGRAVRTITRGWFDAGRHRVAWNGEGERGSRVPVGVYFCRLSSRGVSATRRMVVVR